MGDRSYSLVDQICIQLDLAVKTTFGGHVAARPYPTDAAEATLSPDEQQHSAALMRINHVGEVCAQALYQGQRLATRNQDLAQELSHAALEEIDHLAWTEQRLAELGTYSSYLNPFWYGGAFIMGFVAGKCGDDWSLGFVAETEYQVTYHLEGVADLPAKDQRSFDILSTMRDDELAHADDAVSHGGRVLPDGIRSAMRITADTMKRIAYWV